MKNAFLIFLINLSPIILYGQVDYSSVSSFIDNNDRIESYYELYSSNPNGVRSDLIQMLNKQNLSGQSLHRMLEKNNYSDIANNVGNLQDFYYDLMDLIEAGSSDPSFEANLKYLKEGPDISSLKLFIENHNNSIKDIWVQVSEDISKIQLDTIPRKDSYSNTSTNIVLETVTWFPACKFVYRDLTEKYFTWKQEGLKVNLIINVNIGGEKYRTEALEWIKENRKDNIVYMIAENNSEDAKYPEIEVISKEGTLLNTYAGFQKSEFYDQLKKLIIEND